MSVTPQEIFREATKEERESTQKYVREHSVDTGVSFNNYVANSHCDQASEGESDNQSCITTNVVLSGKAVFLLGVALGFCLGCLTVALGSFITVYFMT